MNGLDTSELCRQPMSVLGVKMPDEWSAAGALSVVRKKENAPSAWQAYKQF